MPKQLNVTNVCSLIFILTIIYVYRKEIICEDIVIMS